MVPRKIITHLRAAKVYVKTDHKALAFMYKSSFTGDQIRRWILATQNYDMTIEHVSSRGNVVADLLSRRPSYELKIRREPLEVIIALTKIQKFSDDFIKSLKNFSIIQQEDPKLAPLIRNAIKFVPGCKLTKDMLQDGIFHKAGRKNAYQIMMPETLIERKITEVHTAYGHIGLKKMIKLLSTDFYIKNMRHVV